MKVNLAKYNNEWYNTGGGIIKRLLWHYTSAIFFESNLFPLVKFKVVLLRLFGAMIGDGVMIKPQVQIKYPWNLKIGDNVWIGEGVWLDSLVNISIGSNACISQGVYILTGNHDFSKSTFDLIVSPVVLEEGVWIGAKSVVCPGVRCGSHSVLSVMSVAAKNLDPYYVYRGNPAIKVKEREILQ